MVPPKGWLRTRIVVALAATLACLATWLVVCAPASAVFSRPFLRQLTGASGKSFASVQGLAIGSNEDLYVATGEMIDQFNANNEIVSQLPAEVMTFELAFDNAAGHLFGVGPHEHIGIDNSGELGDLSAGDVYTLNNGGVSRVNATGEAAPFIGVAEYVNGGVVTGIPGEPRAFEGIASFDSIAVRAGGAFYVADEWALGRIYEFDAQGIYMRTISVQGAPKLGKIAVDPTTDDVVLPTNNQTQGIVAIEEMTEDGEYLGQITGTSKNAPFGHSNTNSTFSIDSGIALNGKGDLYVTDSELNVVDEFGPGGYYPDAVTGSPRANTGSSATLTGVVNDENLAMTDCRFEYVTTAAYGATGFADLTSGGEVPCAGGVGAIPKDSENHAVQAAVTGLTPGTSYTYRLVASTSSSERGGTTEGEAESFIAAAKPAVAGVTISDVSSSWAELHGGIVPNGTSTTYQFEYVSAAQYEPAAADPYAAGGLAPTGGGEIGGGGQDVQVAVNVGGLSPNTTYHVRLQASNATGITYGADSMFTTDPSAMAGLPDGRAYEMLTPPNKEDAGGLFGRGSEEVNYDSGYPSADGEQFLLLTSASFGPFPSSGEGEYVFSRGESGWSFQALASPTLGVQSLTAAVYTPDFSQVGVNDKAGALAAAEELNLVGAPGGPYAEVHGGAYNSPQAGQIVGASSDLSRIIFESENHTLAAADAAQDEGSQALYEWTGGGECAAGAGTCKLINANSEGKLLARCGAVLGAGSEYADFTRGAVSNDGSKVFFTAPDPRTNGLHCWNEGVPPELYMRLDSETTVDISAPEGLKPAGGIQPAVYVGASEDGSKVFFVTTTELTADDKTHAPELYEYNTAAGPGEEKLVRISRGDLASGPTEGDVYDVPAITPDGSIVYFNAGRKLTPDAPEGGGLYRYDTNTGATTYVAPDDGYQGPPPASSVWWEPVLGRGFLGLAIEADYYTTANGQYLVFPSTENITGYESGGQQELYRYDASDGSIVCISCNPNGSLPASGATFTRSAMVDNNPAGGPPRPISEGGEYVFFDTAEALVPQDTNGKIDVYEWHDGTISLITTGEESTNSFFLGSSASGRDVFFGTHAKLVPQDTDSEGDLYDARIGGGFPQPTGAGPCEGDACQVPPTAPIDQTPASLTFSGAGNLAAAPASSNPGNGQRKAKPKKRRRKIAAKKAGRGARRAARRDGSTARSRARSRGRRRRG